MTHLPYDRTQPWSGGSYAITVLDVETSGLKQEEGARVVEIAAVRFELHEGAWKVTDRFASVVKPCEGFVMPEEASAINGLTQELVDTGLSWAEVWPKIAALCTGPTIVAAYNADFDRGHIRTETLRAGFEVGTIPYGLRYDWLDPLVWVREIDRYVKGKGRHRLVETCQRWGIEMGDAHAANADAEAAGWLLLSPKMQKAIGHDRETGAPPALVLVAENQARLRAQQDDRFAAFTRTAKAETVCKSCGAEVLWCETKDGKRMPVDREPVEDGNVQLVGKVANVLDKETLELVKANVPAEALFKSHFATCPEANKHRTPKR